MYYNFILYFLLNEFIIYHISHISTKRYRGDAIKKCLEIVRCRWRKGLNRIQIRTPRGGKSGRSEYENQERRSHGELALGGHEASCGRANAAELAGTLRNDGDPFVGTRSVRTSMAVTGYLGLPAEMANIHLRPPTHSAARAYERTRIAPVAHHTPCIHIRPVSQHVLVTAHHLHLYALATNATSLIRPR